MTTRTQRQEKVHASHRSLQWAFVAAITAALVFFLFVVWFSPISMANQSMYSTINAGDMLLYNRLAKFSRPIRRGEMIVFQHPFTREHLIKRVIALGGERVCIENGRVIINGKYQLDESSYCTSVDFNLSEREVPKGEVFVLSDSRAHKDDSRDGRIGCVPLENILGIVQLRINRFTVFSTTQVKT